MVSDAKHTHHDGVAAALRERVRRGNRIVTTQFVLAEAHALLLHRIHRGAALAFLSAVRQPPNVIVAVDADVLERAQQDWLERYSDQDFSLTDAVSFAVMTERGIKEALTLDRHFATAGFVMVPSAT